MSSERFAAAVAAVVAALKGTSHQALQVSVTSHTFHGNPVWCECHACDVQAAAEGPRASAMFVAGLTGLTGLALVVISPNFNGIAPEWETLSVMRRQQRRGRVHQRGLQQ